MTQRGRPQFLSDSLFQSTQSTLYSSLTITALRLCWIVIIIWGDLGTFFWSLRQCRWPTLDGTRDTFAKSAHVLLLADVQVQHPLLQSKGQPWATIIRRFFFDLNLRKSWHVASRLQPDAVVFLGDMLSNGKYARTEKSYQEAAQKFKSIFYFNPSIPIYFIPGNNDVGMGEITPLAKTVRKYFTDAFGPLSQQFTIRNHTFVALDAPGVVDEDYQRAGSGTSFAKWKSSPDGPIAFVKEIAASRTEKDRTENPLILLSHIPLSRPEGASCGSLREKGTIRRDVGHGYQSMLGRQTTSFLLKNMQPVAIFSGDNRDYCEYNHTIPDDAHAIREVTLKSFSTSIHIHRPGFQLLSLIDPSSRIFPNQQSFADTPCFLPDQSNIFTSLYAPCIILTVIALFIINLRRAKYSSSLRKPMPIRLGTSSSPSPRNMSDCSSPIDRHHLNYLVHDDAAMWTPTWSPYSPPVPPSPRGSILTTLRTPHTAHTSTGSMMRASSRPITPSFGAVPDSSYPTDIGSEHGDEDGNDAMQPVQYPLRREGHRHYDDHDEGWSDAEKGNEDDPEYDFVGGDGDINAIWGAGGGGKALPRLLPHFTSAPSLTRGRRDAALSWSWTFVIRGRRRRITLKVPTFATLRNFVGLVQITSNGRRRTSVVRRTLLDVCNVLWPSLVVWFLIVWSLS